MAGIGNRTSIEDLLMRWGVVYDETIAGANSKTRIGQLGADTVETLNSLSFPMSEKISTIAELDGDKGATVGVHEVSLDMNHPLFGYTYFSLITLPTDGDDAGESQLAIVPSDDLSSTPRLYIRMGSSGSWGDWKEIGGGGSVNVVQESGDSTVDVMSQKAVTDFVNTSINGIGAMKTFYATDTYSLLSTLQVLGGLAETAPLGTPYNEWLEVIPQTYMLPSFRIVYNSMFDGSATDNSMNNFFLHLFETTGIEEFESNPFMRGTIQVDIIPAMPKMSEEGPDSAPTRLWMDCTFMRTYDHLYVGNQLLNVDGVYADYINPPASVHTDTAVYHMRFLWEGGDITYWGAWKQALTEVPIPQEPIRID